MPKSQDLPDLAGINLKQALERCAGDRELFLEILGFFLTTYHQVVPEIQTALSQGDLKQAQFLVHAVKGAAGSISALNLHQAAGQLEKVLRSGALVPMESYLQEMIRTLNPVLEKISLRGLTRFDQGSLLIPKA